jgi:hypothetical protein
MIWFLAFIFGEMYNKNRQNPSKTLQNVSVPFVYKEKLAFTKNKGRSKNLPLCFLNFSAYNFTY